MILYIYQPSFQIVSVISMSAYQESSLSLGVAPSQVPVTFSDHSIFSRKSPKKPSFATVTVLQCYGGVLVCKLF